MAKPDDLTTEQIETGLRAAVVSIGGVSAVEPHPVTLEAAKKDSSPAAPASASGANGDAPRADLATSETPEAGSGVQLFGGTLFRMEDYNVDLQGQAGMLIYEKMYRGDPDVASGISRLTWPIGAAEWSIEPADDSDEEREIAEFCEKWIFGKGRTDPFAMNLQDFLRHVMLMFPFGCSAFEKVWGTDELGRDVYARLIPILPKTIEEFQFTNKPGGQLEYLLQRGWVLGKGWTEAKVRSEKLMLFVNGREGDNLFGWSICRAAYKPWHNKEIIEIIDGIRIERNGIGFFVITVPAGSKDKVRDAAKKVAQSMRVHEKQGIIVETGTTVEILYPSGADPKIVESIQLLRAQILQVLLSEFAEHGSSAVGSKALVGSKIDFLLMCLQGAATGICDVIDRQAIPDLVEMNWGKRKKLPKAKCDQISKMSLADSAEWISKLVTCGALTLSPEIEQFLLKMGKLPLIPEKDLERYRKIHDMKIEAALKLAENPPPALPPGAPVAVATPPADPNAPPAPPADPSKAKETKKPVDAPSKAARMMATLDARTAEATRRIFEGENKADPLWRAPREKTSAGTPHPESSCEFTAMKAYMQTEPKRVWASVVKPWRRSLAKVAAQRLTKMSDDDLKRGAKSIVPPRLREKFSSELESSFIAVYQSGRKSVRDEYGRQIDGAPSPPKQAALADIVAKVTAKQIGWVKTIAGGYVLGLIQGMEKRAADEALTVRQAELSESEQLTRIEDAIMELSEPTLQAELTGDMGRAFVTGREDQAESLDEEIDTAFYSAIMDDGTQECEDRGGTCSALDGEEHEPGDPDFQAPNPNCAWPPYCRCVNVYVFKREKEAA